MLLVGIALMAGLYLIGPAMGMWSKDLMVSGEVNTGELTGKILFTGFTEKVDKADDGKSILFTGSEDQSQQIKIDIVLEPDKVNQESDKTNWEYSFTIENQGTIPVRFLTPEITPNADNADKALSLTCTLPENVTDKNGLNPGESVEGQITIALQDVTPGTHTFHIDLKCIQWNAYGQDPVWWNDTLKIDGTVTVGATKDTAEDAKSELTKDTATVAKPELTIGKVKVTVPESNADTAEVTKPESTEGTTATAESE